MSLWSVLIPFFWSRNDRKRDRGLVPPDSLVRHLDISYGPRKEQLLDVYLPNNAIGPLPVIVSVHGGGWVYGDKELYSHYCMDLATRGFAVVNFTYRLSPAYRFPCHLEDTALAFHWVRQHSREYGLDGDRVFAVGDSAGAHILALYCCLCTNPDDTACFGLSASPDLVPRAVALNCGVYDLTQAKASGSNTLQLMKDVLGHRASDAELRAMSPVTYLTSAFPPCYIMTANQDFLKGQPGYLTPLLRQLQVPHELHCYGDEQSPLGHVFHLNIRSPQAIACNDAECDFFRRYIHKT